MLVKIAAGILATGFGLIGFFASLPATSTYQLQSFGFGSGGTGNSTTGNYGLEGITGELSGQTANTATYNNNSGFIQTEQANVPKVTLTNPSNYYDKLHFTIDQQNNPSDAFYALQISTSSNFSSNVNYVQTDFTIGSTLTITQFQTYSTWAAGSSNIIGLANNTTYYLRAAAYQGKYTQSAWGPSANAATVGQQISFCLYSNANCGAGGNSEAFGALTVGSPNNSPTNIGIDIATNADAGARVYVYSQNGGLQSAHASYTITSATANLASASEGFGAQITSVSQTSGGPLNKVSPFDGSGNNVGALATTASYLLSSLNPLVGGSAAVQLQVRPSNTTPSANDYSETLTFIAAAAF